MPRQQVIDEIADDRVRLVSELRHDAANQRSAATVPLQIDRAVEITRAMDLGPAVRAAGLFRPDFDEIEFLFELRIAHDFRAERTASCRDDLEKRLQLSLGSMPLDFLQFLFSVAVADEPCVVERVVLNALLKMSAEGRVKLASSWGQADPPPAPLQVSKHHVDVDATFLWMLKRAGQCADDFDAEQFPQAHGMFLSRDHEIKLHGGEAQLPRLVQAMFSHCSSQALALGSGRDHEAGIGNMRAATGSIRP